MRPSTFRDRLHLPAVLFFSCASALAARAQTSAWTQQAPLPTGQDLHAVQVLSDTELWVTGGEGLLAHTTDAGQSWQTKTVASNSLWALCFLDAQHGWAAGNGFFHTTDGGQNWIQDNTWGSIYDLHFVDAQRGWACGNGGVTYRTVNGGASWDYTAVGPITTLSSIWFEDAQNGWTVDIEGRIYRSTNGGFSWSLQWHANEYLSTLQFFDLSEGWAIGGDTFLHTVNGGQSWTPANVPPGTWSHGARFASDRVHGIAVGEYGNIVVTADGGQSWIEIAPIGSGPRLWDVESSGPAVAVYCGETGGLARTANGGLDWSSLQSGGAGTTHGLDALDASRAWAANDGGEILRTEDGGAHWQRIAVEGFDNYGRLQDVDFVDASRGWAVGRHEYFAGGDGKIVRSDDGGASWSVQHVVPAAYFDAVEVLDAQTVLALGQIPLGPRFILRSTNGGQSWTDVSPSQAVFMDADFVDPGTGWVVGGRIYKSLDGGQSWSLQHTPSELLYSVSFADAQNGWAVGWGPTLLHTTDGGQTWSPQDANAATNVLLSVEAIDANVAWISGANGFVARTSDGGQSWTPEAPPGTAGVAFEALAFLDGERGWAGGEQIWKRGAGSACPPPQVYCLPKQNSAGGYASIGSLGSASVGGGAFRLTVTDALPGKLGLFYFGEAGPASLPFHNGLLCVLPPLQRFPPFVLGPGGAGEQLVPMTAALVGQTRWYQFWHRDPFHPDGTGVSLSDGLQVTYCE